MARGREEASYDGTVGANMKARLDGVNIDTYKLDGYSDSITVFRKITMQLAYGDAQFTVALSYDERTELLDLAERVFDRAVLKLSEQMANERILEKVGNPKSE